MTAKEAYEAVHVANEELWDAMAALDSQKAYVDRLKIRAYEAREDWHRIREMEERNAT